MMPTLHLSSIEYFIQANHVLVYLIIFLGMFIEGEGIILFASIFAWQGYLSWTLVGMASIAGTICGDLLWYSAGKFLKDTKFGIWLDGRYEKTGAWVHENIVNRYAFYAIISKFMYFTTRPTIFLAGWHGFEFKKFVRITSVATVIWALIVLGLGYFFGAAVHAIGFKTFIKKIEFFAIAVFVAIFIVEYLFKKFYFKKQRTRQLKP